MTARHNFRKGTCPICHLEEVSGKHYKIVHGFGLQVHFNPVSGAGKEGLARCIHCGQRAERPHKAVAHLVEAHSELLPQAAKGSVSAGEHEGMPESAEVDPEWAMANATVGGVFEFLVDMRRTAEAKAECMRVSMSTLEGKLAEAQSSISILREAERVLQKENAKLRQDNERLVADNKAMNEQMLRMRNGGASVAEFRAVYGELQGRR